MPADRATPFVHRVSSPGAAQGMTFTGLARFPDSSERTGDVPLVIAVHGGGYTSAYFDVPGYSLLDRAAGLRIPIIAVDRPSYGGSSPVRSGESVLLANAAALDHLVAGIWASGGHGAAGVFVIGHSIGAAITMAIAARRPSWPLLGIAVSGCLLREPRNMYDLWAAIPGDTLESPPDQKAVRMFGPEWTRRGDMPEASYPANAPVLRSELLDVSSTWHGIFREEVAPNIAVPTHLRVGEFETFWIVNDEEVAECAALLSSSPLVDAQVFPSCGHVIDYHRASAAFQVQQLSFALNCCAQRVSAHA